MGKSSASLALKSKSDGLYLINTGCIKYESEIIANEIEISKVSGNEIFLRAKVLKGAKCVFSYSLDGKKYVEVNESFQAEAGQWIGAKVGLFCTRQDQTNDSGYMDVDWFRVEPLK